MSGLEIVGVVLGAVPLIISILENYKALGRKTDAFRRKSFYIDRMINALTWQKTLIEGDIEIVLRNAGVADAYCQVFGTESYEVVLKQPDVQHSVQALLGPRYEPYLQVLSECERALISIARSVKGLQRGVWVDNGKLTDMLRTNQPLLHGDHAFWKKLKFSMHKDELETTISKLDSTSQLLTRLRETTQEINQMVMQSPSGRSKSMISFLQKIQKKAHALYWAVSSSWAKSCHDGHAARLYLENRIDRLEAGVKKTTAAKTPVIEFKVAFGTLVAQGNAPYHICSIEVLQVDIPQPEKQRKAATVSFNVPDPIPDPKARTKAIDNICDTIMNDQGVQESLRMFLRHDGKLCYSYAPGQTPASAPPTDGNFISLQEILQQRKKRLSLRHRVRMAATVASSAMQLHTTPWLTTLRKDSLLFAELSDGATRSWLDVEHPFVSCAFDKPPAPNIKAQAEAELLDLGILITELWHNESVESFATSVGLPLLDTYDSRQSVARAWLQETKDDMLPPVHGAARRCVECRFDALDVDWDDQEVNASIFEGVVRPLWENVRES